MNLIFKNFCNSKSKKIGKSFTFKNIKMANYSAKPNLIDATSMDYDFLTSNPAFKCIQSPHIAEMAMAIQKFQGTKEYEEMSEVEKMRVRLIKAEMVLQTRIPLTVKNAFATPLKKPTKKVQLSFVGYDVRMVTAVKRIKQAMDLCPGLVRVK